MMLLLASLAAAACDPAAALASLRTSGTRDAYLCVSAAEEGRSLLLVELGTNPEADNNRITRALTLWLLMHTDRAMEPDDVAKLSPADRRLLGDGIRARRGRASPSPEHAAIFEQFSWYAPVANYTDGRLRPIDRANLEVVDPKVRPEPEDAAGPVADAPAVGLPSSAATPGVGGGAQASRCGCASDAPRGGLLLGLLALVFRRRERG